MKRTKLERLCYGWLSSFGRLFEASKAVTSKAQSLRLLNTINGKKYGTDEFLLTEEKYFVATMLSTIQFLKKSTTILFPALSRDCVGQLNNKLTSLKSVYSCVHSSTSVHNNNQNILRSPAENLHEEVPDKLYKLIEVEVRGNDKEVLKSYAWFTKTAANHLGIEVGKSWTPERPHHERYTVLRSVHVNKKCRVQYEFRTYFQFLQFHKMTGSTADTFLEYIQRNLPEGVAMKVTKVGLETIPEYIQAPEETCSADASSSS